MKKIDFEAVCKFCSLEKRFLDQLVGVEDDSQFTHDSLAEYIRTVLGRLPGIMVCLKIACKRTCSIKMTFNEPLGFSVKSFC